MTKEDILHHFQDINFYYGDCMMYADLNGMLDELIAENKAEWLDDVKAEIVALPNANPSYWHSGDMVEREEVLEILDNIGKESEDVVVANKNLCDSCTTKNCIFQSGIVRNHCDFYKAESEEN